MGTYLYVDAGHKTAMGIMRRKIKIVMKEEIEAVIE